MQQLLRRTGMLSMAAVSIFLLCGDTAPQTCNTQPVTNDHLGRDVALVGVALGAVIVTTVVLVHNHNASHRLKGCVTSGPGGLKLTTEDHKSYSLAGDVHGTKIKRAKGDTSDQTFTVESLSKDYGVCKIALSAPASAATASTAF